MRAFALALVFAALAACSKPAASSDSAADLKAPAAAEEAKSTSRPLASTPAATGPMLAYAYEFGLEAPASQIQALVEKEQAACSNAGATNCAVTGSSLDRSGSDDVSAKLTLKASPAWLSRFRTELADDTKAVGGRIASSSVTSEDLSLQIVDANAHLRAQTALRDRLQDALRHRPGKTSDFVDAATALAKAQGDLDAMQSELAILQRRVAMSDVTIAYSAAGSLASGNTWAPVSAAVHGFAGMIAMALAAMVTIVGFLLPWAITAAAVIWVIVTLRKGRERRKPS
jgi:hypothetical protein